MRGGLQCKGDLAASPFVVNIVDTDRLIGDSITRCVTSIRAVESTLFTPRAFDLAVISVDSVIDPGTFLAASLILRCPRRPEQIDIIGMSLRNRLLLYLLKICPKPVFLTA